MTEQSELFVSTNHCRETTPDGSPLWWKIQSVVNSSSGLFIKKLSRNDTSWAEGGSNQAGFYIPKAARDSGFFPVLNADNPDKPHIFHAELGILWPQTGEVTRSQMRHFSNKGSEAHVTVVARPLFRGLTPASLLLMGRFSEPVGNCPYWAVILDSETEEAELLETVLDLDSTFHYSLFSPTVLEDSSRLAKDETSELIDRLQHAVKTGTLQDVLSDYAAIPDAASIASDARSEWLQRNGMDSFDPWSIASPGDAIMEISRDIEYRIYKRYELKRRTAELVAILAGTNDLVTGLVNNFPEIDRVFLSASQQRKTRAGRSFEHHIAASLSAGRIRFTEQAVTGGRRPDFVLPDTRTLRKRNRPRAEALVLAAKTTLRERWKQVSSESLNCDVFLATVDDRVAGSSIREMAASGIQLVVPESLKKSDEAHYKDEKNVHSFREFYDNLRRDRSFLILPA